MVYYFANVAWIINTILLRIEKKLFFQKQTEIRISITKTISFSMQAKQSLCCIKNRNEDEGLVPVNCI